MVLQTATFEASEAADAFYEAGWTDGLPIVLPTPERVERMLAATTAGPDDAVGAIPELDVLLTAGSAAANAVMAGCRPKVFPVVLAALGAALDPAFHLPVVATSTGGPAIGVHVTGPLAAQLGMNGSYNVLGGDNRANATIGRAVRLAAKNLLGVGSTRVDGSSLGHPGRLSLCFADGDPPPGWPPLQTDLGYDAEATVVSVFATDGPRQIANHLSEDPDDILATFAAALSSPWHFPVGKGGVQVVVVLGPEHAGALAGAGLSRADVCDALVARTPTSLEQLAAAGVTPERGSQHEVTPDAAGRMPTIAQPEDVLVTTAGGPGAGWSAVLPSWAPKLHSLRRTVRVRHPEEGLPPCGPDGGTVQWS